MSDDAIRVLLEQAEQAETDYREAMAELGAMAERRSN